MDSKQHSNVIQSLKENNEVNVILWEQNQRQFISELKLKRTQVEELWQELDAANLKINELTRILETKSSVCRDSEFNLNLMMQRIKYLEEKLRDRKDSVITARLQHETLIAENKTLKGIVEKARIENRSHVHTIEDLKLQHHNDIIYRNELIGQDSNIRRLVTKFTEAMEKLENDCKLAEISNQIETCENLQKSLEFYRNENKAIKNRKEIIERKYIIQKAKLEKLEELYHSYPPHQEKRMSVLCGECPKLIENHGNQIRLLQDAVKDLTAKLNVETESNIQFCERDNAVTQEIENLTHKLSKFNVKDASTQTEGVESIQFVEIKQECDVEIIN